MKVGLISFFTFFLLNILFLPKEFYGGAAKSSLLEAQHLLREGHLGMSDDNAKEFIPSIYFKKKGSFYSKNPVNGNYYSRWSLPNTLAYLPPFSSRNSSTARIIPSIWKPEGFIQRLWT